MAKGNAIPYVFRRKEKQSQTLTNNGTILVIDVPKAYV